MSLILFPGTNAPTPGGASAPGVFLFPFPGGSGIFPGVYEGAGGDLRSAAILFTAVQNLTERTNYLFNRLPDFVSGGNYSGFTGALTLGGMMTWTGEQIWSNTSIFEAGAAFIGVAQTVQVGGVGSSINIAVALGSSISLAGSFTSSSGSGFTLVAGTNISIQAGINRTSYDLPSGSGAYRGLREVAGPTTSGNVVGSAQDELVFNVNVGASNAIVVTLDAPSVGTTFVAILGPSWAGSGSSVTFVNHDASSISGGTTLSVAGQVARFTYSVIAGKWFAI